MASLQELETFWSLDDVERAIAYLDMMQDLQNEVRQGGNGIKRTGN